MSPNPPHPSSGAGDQPEDDGPDNAFDGLPERRMLSEARRSEIVELYFHHVLRQTFQGYPDPRLDVQGIARRAFAQSLPGIPEHAGDGECVSAVLDKAMDLAKTELDSQERNGAGVFYWHAFMDLYADFDPGDEGNPKLLIDGDPELTRAVEAMDGLPDQEKIAFHLMVVYKMTSSDAARLIGKVDATVRGNRKRAQERLTSAGVSVEELIEFFREIRRRDE